ncbi:uncharacterized protein CCOS01_07615 [Colletotrichum costaricense]|uniref:Uncharacterized protein n=1 Tax=Colletotrichum costaricense TaxID=1209916 RepID=A0AAI9YXC1_9PEZI|nr:uncharacterized protein CCOS01_07615 [Colletotrichum costaricense]KAK1527353.1 hypothetical protein CCOS01_07615 [Colletotrichum costaricense]
MDTFGEGLKESEQVSGHEEINAVTPSRENSYHPYACAAPFRGLPRKGEYLAEWWNVAVPPATLYCLRHRMAFAAEVKALRSISLDQASGPGHQFMPTSSLAEHPTTVRDAALSAWQTTA